METTFIKFTHLQQNQTSCEKVIGMPSTVGIIRNSCLHAQFGFVCLSSCRYPPSQGSQASTKISCTIKAFGYALYCALHSGYYNRLTVYIASIGDSSLAIRLLMVCRNRWYLPLFFVIYVQLSNDELVLEENGIQLVICTADLLQDLLNIRNKIPEFPSKKDSKCTL